MGVKLNRHSTYDVYFLKRVKNEVTREYEDQEVLLGDNLDAVTTSILLDALKLTGNINMRRVRRVARKPKKCSGPPTSSSLESSSQAWAEAS